MLTRAKAAAKATQSHAAALSIKSSKAYADMKTCFAELLDLEDKAAVYEAYYQARTVAINTPKATPGASKTLLHAFTRLLIGLMGQDRCARPAAVNAVSRPRRPLTPPRAAPSQGGEVYSGEEGFGHVCERRAAGVIAEPDAAAGVAACPAPLNISCKPYGDGGHGPVGRSEQSVAAARHAPEHQLPGATGETTGGASETARSRKSRWRLVCEPCDYGRGTRVSSRVPGVQSELPGPQCRRPRGGSSRSDSLIYIRPNTRRS